MGRAWPLVGRQEELAFVDDVLAGGGGGVVLAGAAGVGKSRLAAESLAMAASKGFSTRRAVGTVAAATLPFGPLAHLLPDQLPTAPDRENVLRIVADSLLQQAGGSRVAFGVDDAHLLDPLSAAVLLQLALRAEAFLIVTVRTGKPTPDPVVELWKGELCDRLELQPLSRPETEQLLELALDGLVAGSTVHKLWELTRGNPLFLRELVLEAIEDGSLTQTEGLWRWRGRSGGHARLREVLGSRLEGLPDDERDALEIAALGEPLELEMLLALASTEVLVRLERRGLLAESRDDHRITVRPAHPIYGEILRSGVSPSRAREISLKLADAMDASGAGVADDSLRNATWRLEAGALGEPGLYLTAAEQALGLFEYELAARLALAAVNAGAGFEASVLLARAFVGEGRFTEAEDLLARLMAEAGSGAELTKAALTRATNLYMNLGRPEQAAEVIAVAERAITDHELRLQLTANRGSYLYQGANAQQAIDAGLSVLRDPMAPSLAVAEGFAAAGPTYAYTGRPELALELLNEHLDRALPALPQLPYGPIAVVGFRTLARLLAGRFLECEEEADLARRGAQERSPEWVTGYFTGMVGVVLRAQGRVRSASRLLREAIALLRKTNVAGQLTMLLAEQALSLALQGDPDSADDALRDAEEARVPGERFLQGWVSLPRTWITVARGETTKAVAEAMKVAEELGAMGWLSQQAVALHDAARLGEAKAVVEPLAGLAEECDAPIVPLYARHARALVARDGAELDRVSAEFEKLGAYLLAAEAAAEASRCHEDSGHRRAAVSATSRATTLAAKCEGAKTPALAELAEPLPLTRREREVATLAARGLSNQQIAERLFVSVRTVANHLHSAYGKLGVDGRDDLRAITGL